MGAVMENECKNIFTSDKTKIRETFTLLWTQVINEKENGIKVNKDVQTNIV